MIVFKGFSTVGQKRAPFVLNNQDLVKRDLLNEFYTKRGERVMRPNFGSIIWDLLMNPMDNFTQQDIKDDILRIINRDPRVKHLNTVLYILDNSIRAEVQLQYVSLNSEDTLFLEFEKNNLEGIN